MDFQMKTSKVNMNLIPIYVHQLTTAITFGYFDAILKKYIGITLKFL